MIQYICDDIAVLYLGQIVETGTSESLFANPAPHTRALLAAVLPPIPQAAGARRSLRPAASPVDPRRAAASPRSARARWTSAVASRRRLWRPPPQARRLPPPYRNRGSR
ncbi:MAG: hypothetical protein ACLR0N_10690 [Bilophila wadsworthia]